VERGSRGKTTKGQETSNQAQTKKKTKTNSLHHTSIAARKERIGFPKKASQKKKKQPQKGGKKRVLLISKGRHFQGSGNTQNLEKERQKKKCPGVFPEWNDGKGEAET